MRPKPHCWNTSEHRDTTNATCSGVSFCASRCNLKSAKCSVKGRRLCSWNGSVRPIFPRAEAVSSFTPRAMVASRSVKPFARCHWPLASRYRTYQHGYSRTILLPSLCNGALTVLSPRLKRANRLPFFSMISASLGIASVYVRLWT